MLPNDSNDSEDSEDSKDPTPNTAFCPFIRTKALILFNQSEAAHWFFMKLYGGIGYVFHVIQL